MKVLLIYPTITTKGNDPSLYASPMPPFGLLYIASVIEKKGHNVKILDCLAEGIDNIECSEDYSRQGLSSEDIKKQIVNFCPEIIGISSQFTSYADDAHQIAALAKSVLPQVPIVFGGSHVSSFYDKILQDKNVDIAVIGEGEITFTEIVENYSKKKYWLNIRGTAVRTANEIKVNEPREFIKDLDELPLPARHLIKMETYLFKHKNPYTMRTPHTFIITSRGCPLKCVYCSIHAVWRHTWRPRGVKSVVDEIEMLVNKYGIREIHILDDNVSVNKKRMEQLVEEIIKRNLNIKWTCPNGIAIWTLTDELLKKMKKSGCYRLTFGIETGCQETQQFIKKKLDLEKAKQLIKEANKLGIWTAATFIIGFPYDTKEQINDSLNFAIETKLDFPVFYTLMPFPRTELWDIVIKEGLLETSEFFQDTGYFLSSRGLDTKNFKKEDFVQIISGMYKKSCQEKIIRLFRNPSHYIKKVNSYEDLRYFLKLTAIFFGMVFKQMFKSNLQIGGGILWKSKKRRHNTNGG